MKTKKIIAEITIKLTEQGENRTLESSVFGDLKDFAEVAQILKENKIENSKIIILFSTISKMILEKKTTTSKV